MLSATMFKDKILLVLATAALAGCSSGSVDIGGNGEKVISIESYAASWDGYIEAHTFLSGSDRVRLVLDANGAGTVRFGDADLIPPATDPNTPYPPGAEFVVQEVVEGFLYPIHDVRVDLDRLSLSINYPDLYADQCAMQTPFFYDTGSGREQYNCVRNWSAENRDGTCYQTNDVTNEEIVVGCWQLQLCVHYRRCECTADACTASFQENGATAILDGALENDGQRLVGTLTLPESGTIRLQRQ
jgi:hypothetical protein